MYVFFYFKRVSPENTDQFLCCGTSYQDVRDAVTKLIVQTRTEEIVPKIEVRHECNKEMTHSRFTPNPSWPLEVRDVTGLERKYSRWLINFWSFFLCFCFVFLCPFSEAERLSGQPPGLGLVQTGHLPLQVTWRQQTSIPAGNIGNMCILNYVYCLCWTSMQPHRRETDWKSFFKESVWTATGISALHSCPIRLEEQAQASMWTRAFPFKDKSFWICWFIWAQCSSLEIFCSFLWETLPFSLRLLP